ncbi:Hypothetical protein FKW44_009734, partial [Caligus rogercresseyi]
KRSAASCMENAAETLSQQQTCCCGSIAVCTWKKKADRCRWFWRCRWVLLNGISLSL